MTVRVKLTDIVEGIESQSYERSVYLNKKTGKIVLVTHDESSVAESEDSLEEWTQGSLAQEVLDDDENYAALPTEFDIDDARIMEAFCRTLKDEKPVAALRVTLKTKNPARRFRDAVRDLGLTDAWKAHHHAALNKIAREWCEENGIPFTDA